MNEAIFESDDGVVFPLVDPYEEANGTVQGIKRGMVPTNDESSDRDLITAKLPGMELPSDLPDHYTLGDIIRERTDSEYPDYQPHLSDETYMFRKPTVFGEPDTDVEDDDGYPDEQSHPDDSTDKKFKEKERACVQDGLNRTLVRSGPKGGKDNPEPA